MRVEYATIDVLANPQYLAALAVNVPCVFLNGVKAGGIDSLDALALKPEFKSVQPKKTLNEKIEDLLKGSEVLLFMKGTPSQP